MVQQITNVATFQSVLARQRVIVIDFYAPWCGPCRAFAPRFEAMVAEYPGVSFYKVNVDDNEDISELVQIQAMPTFVVFKSGREVARVQGANEIALRAALQKHM